MALEPRRQLLVSRGWVQAVAIVMIFGFTVMGMLAYQTYTGEPPIPARVTDAAGHVLFTRSDILAGQGVFLRNGLMEYGSIFGHGAYLGPDFTADYLHRAALSENPLTAQSCRRLPILRIIDTTALPTL
jgi:nitric oxide reductase subunit B